jgi:8-oxo-dGTP diphosphatase
VKVERASVIILSGPHILFIERYKEGRGPYYVLPGGKLEEGEEPEQAARRELREELDLELGALEPIHGSPFPYKYHPAGNWIFRTTLQEPVPVIWQEPYKQTDTNSYQPVWLSIHTLARLTVLPEDLTTLL